MPEVAFGTAPIHDAVDRVTSMQMLEEAWRVGFRRFDTAPMYGGGRCEPDVGTLLSAHPDVEVVTTKVGLPPEPGRRLHRRVVAGLARRMLPASAIQRLRRRQADTSPPPRELFSGRFTLPEVRASVEQSLRRLHGRVDRLLLHEVRPLDVTPELMEALAEWVQKGDVGAVGVATQNHDTAEAVAAGGDLLTVVNVAVGPLHEPVALPDHVTTRIGHGLLGAASAHLRRLQAVLDGDPVQAEQWRSATTGTEFEGPDGLARVLLSRGPHLGVDEVLVATTRLARIAPAYEHARRQEPLPSAVVATLDGLVAGARSESTSAG